MVLMVLPTIGAIHIVECRWGDQPVIGTRIESLSKCLARKVGINNSQSFTPSLLSLANDAVKIPVRNLGGQILRGALDASAR
jgi:hypothetical protein